MGQKISNSVGKPHAYTATVNFKTSPEIKAKFDLVTTGEFDSVYSKDNKKLLKPVDRVITRGTFTSTDNNTGKKTVYDSGHDVTVLGFSKKNIPIVIKSVGPHEGVRPAGPDNSKLGYDQGGKVKKWVYRYK